MPTLKFPGRQDRFSLLGAGEGFVSQTYDRATTQGSLAVVAQDINASLAYFYAGEVVANLQAMLTAAPGTPAGLTAGRLCLFSKAGVLLAVTADCSVTFQSTTDTKSVAVASTWNGAALGAAASYTIPTSDVYFLGAWFDGTSMPSIARGIASNGSGRAVGSGSHKCVRQSTIAVATLTAGGGFTATFAVPAPQSICWFGAA
jgi:hypothetical protein